MSKPPHELEKKKGLSHLFAATRYSWEGFKYMLGEVPFRHEVAALILILVVLFWVGASIMHIMIVLSLGLAAFAVEAINSALELIVDRTSPEISEYAKHAKDVGSFAVFCMLCATGAFSAYALLSAIG